MLVESLFFFSSRRRHTRYWRDWSSDVCSSDLPLAQFALHAGWSPADQIRDHARERVPALLQIGMGGDVLERLLDPTHQVPADVEQHPDLAVAAVEQTFFELFRGVVSRREQALEHEA